MNSGQLEWFQASFFHRALGEVQLHPTTHRPVCAPELKMLSTLEWALNYTPYWIILQSNLVSYTHRVPVWDEMSYVSSSNRSENHVCRADVMATHADIYATSEFSMVPGQTKICLILPLFLLRQKVLISFLVALAVVPAANPNHRFVHMLINALSWTHHCSFFFFK